MQSAYDVTRPNGSGRRALGDRVTFVFRLYRINRPPVLSPILAPTSLLGSIQSGLQTARTALARVQGWLPQSGPHVGRVLEKEYRFVMIVEHFDRRPEVRSHYQYTEGGFFIDMPLRNAKGKVPFVIRGRAHWTPVLVDGVFVDGDAAIKEFSEMIGDYFFPTDGSPSTDHELYFLDLLSTISAEDPFGEFEWLIQPTTGVLQSMRHDKPWQRFYEFRFDGLQSNRDFARSEDGFLQSLFSKGPLAALLAALHLDALAAGIEAVFGILSEFKGLVDDVTNLVQSVNDYLRGVTQFIRESFATVRAILTSVNQLIPSINDGIQIAKRLPDVFTEQWHLLSQTWKGLTSYTNDVLNQTGVATGILTCAEAATVRDLLLALLAQPAAFRPPIATIAAVQTIAVRVEPDTTIERIAASMHTDAPTLIVANNLRYPFVDARPRPETQRDGATDEVRTLSVQLAEAHGDAASVAAAVTAARADEPPPHTAAHVRWQDTLDRALRTQSAWHARVASLAAAKQQAADAQVEWQAVIDTGNPTNPRVREHATQPGVLYAGDLIRVPQPRPDLVPSIIGVDGNMVLNTGVATTDEERLFGIDLLLDDDKNLEWDLANRDLVLVRGLENIARTQVRYVRLPLGQLRFAPGIGNFAYADIARWQSHGTNRLLAYALYRTISQDPRVRRVHDLRAVTSEGVAQLAYRAELIDGMSVAELRTPINLGGVRMPLEMPTADELERRIVFRLAGQQVQLTDFTTISTTRILIREMIVEELMRLYAFAIQANNDWYLDTDSVTALDRRLADFERARPGALPAYGFVQIAVTADTDVRPGAIVRTDPRDGSAPKRYAIDPNLGPDLDAGDTLDSPAWHIRAGYARTLPITATVTGPDGNTAPGTITVGESIPNVVPGGSGITNFAPIDSGRAVATNAEFLQAFRDWLTTLNRGTRPAILAALRTFSVPGAPADRPRVRSSAVVEWNGRSMLRSDNRDVGMIIYIDGGQMTWPSPTNSAQQVPLSEQDVADVGLVNAARAFLRGTDTEQDSGHTAAGVPWALHSAKSLAIPISVQVFVDASLSMPVATGLVRAAILSHFAGIPCAGRTVLGELQGQFSLSHLNRDILNIPGVLRTVFNPPTVTDRQIPVGYKAIAGVLDLQIQVVT